MTPPVFRKNNPEQVWPSHTIATPLKSVTIEVSPYPPSVTVLFDIAGLLAAGKGGARGGQAVAKAASKFAAKGASEFSASAAKAVSPPAGDQGLLESLKTFLEFCPSLAVFSPALDLAVLLGRISSLQ